MAIEVSKFHHIQVACDLTLRKLNDLKNVEYLPVPLVAELQKLITSFEAYDLEQHRDASIKTKGTIVKVSTLQKVLISTSGYNKWNLFDREDEDLVLSSEDFLDMFGICVAERDISSFSFERTCSNRSEICMVHFVCIPEYIAIAYATNHVYIGADVLIKNDELTNALNELFSS